MQDQISRTQTITDMMDPARGRALQAALGLAQTIDRNSPLPPFFHHLHFWDPQPPSALGRDGHVRPGLGLVPDMGLPRRMWAAGRLVFHAPLLAGIQAERISTVEAVTRKDGRSGALAFVRLRHDIRQRHMLVLSEWQELVYREDPAAAPAPPAPPQARTDEDHREALCFDATLLFRYSALTCNGHRIHLDADYAREVEGYAGRVVHGPLIAQMMLLTATARLGRAPAAFTYRATAPLLQDEAATLCMKDGALWLRGAEGRQFMAAEVR